MRLIHTLLLFSLVLFSNFSQADNVRNEIIELHVSYFEPLLCSNNSFLDCLNVKKTSCVNAVDIVSKRCISNKFVKSMSEDTEFGEEISKIIKEDSIRYIECFMANFTDELALTASKYEGCTSYVEEVLKRRNDSWLLEYQRKQNK